MACGRCNCYFSFWAVFCPFTPVTARKMKISKKWKKYPEISFHTSVPNIMIICYTVPERWHVTHVIFFFPVRAIFYPFSPLTVQKMKISKKWKKCLEKSSFYTCIPKIMIR